MVENKENISLDVVMDKPLLPLRDVVVYPHMVIPLFVGREKSKHPFSVTRLIIKR